MNLSTTLKSFLSFFLITFLISCTDYDAIPKFDDSLHKEIKSAWTKKNLKNYSFEYEIFPYSWGPISIKGQVAVSGGKSSVKITENNNQEVEQEYCINTIEEVFEIIRNKYNEAVQFVKSENYKYCSCEIQSYDKKNSIPLDFYVISIEKHKNGADGNSGFSFRIKITNFSVA